MNILAIETVTELSSVALLTGEEVLVRECYAEKSHTERVLPMIDELLADSGIVPADCDAICFDRGPGAFTGVRISTSMAQGLALGIDCPVIPLSSLAVLAQGASIASGHENILACIDARKSEVYWACYQFQHGGISLHGEEQVAAPDNVRLPGDSGWYGAGSGFVNYADELNSQRLVELKGYTGHQYPHARDMLVLAQTYLKSGDVMQAENALPVYLRDNIVTTGQ